MVCRECQAFPGLKNTRKGTVLRDKLVIKDNKEFRVQEKTEGEKGHLGRVGHQESWE